MSRVLASLCALVVGFAADAQADEAIARRLGALHALVGLTSTQPPAARAPQERSCPASPWWRTTRYSVRDRTDTAIRDASIRFRVDRDLIRSVIRHESNYDIDAVSHKGAMGLMQLMPGTAGELGVACPFDPRQNILGGTRYLRQLRDQMGSWPRTVAAYHCGPSCVDSGRIPRGTRRYAERVLRSWRPERFDAVSFGVFGP